MKTCRLSKQPASKQPNPKKPVPVSICPETKLTELLSVLASTWWTILLILPVHLFSTNPSFASMERYPEHCWAWITSLVTILQVIAQATRRCIWRLLALALGVFVWGAVGTSLASASPHWYGLPINTGFGIYSATALVNTLAMAGLWPYIISDVLAWYEKKQLGRYEKTLARRSSRH